MTSPSLIVALDRPHVDATRRLVAALASETDRFKVGSALHTHAGPVIVGELVAAGHRVFLDLKFHDTPATVAGAVEAAARQDVDLVTVHAAGGPAMLEAARRAADDVGGPTRLVAVTVLTSIDAATHERLWGAGARSLEASVEALARLAVECGMDGCVCSPAEVGRLRRALGAEPVLVVPGIRPAWSASDHLGQVRTATPAAAAGAGATCLVLGRAVTAADDPAAALRRVRAELDG